MHRDEDIARAIRQRDVGAIGTMMFDGTPPSIREGFRTETVLWDFKRDCPRLGRESAGSWASLAVDVLAFHNSSGGIVVFGIDNDYQYCGATTTLDSKLVNDQLRKYLRDTIWVEYHRSHISRDQRYLGMALVPPRGPHVERFRIDAPEINGIRAFRTGDSAIREGDSSRIVRKDDVATLDSKIDLTSLGEQYALDEPYFRILSPEYSSFIERAGPCSDVESALSDPRASITSIVGIGGTGKTALATWAAIRAHRRKQFQFIASITAKDRALSPSGIQALAPGLSSFESLLDNVAEVLGFPEIKADSVESREATVRELLKNSNGLLFVDNLETVDDVRIIKFLDSLPVGVRALTTSRRASVRYSVHPVDLAGLTEIETNAYISLLSGERRFEHVSELSQAERTRIGKACDGLPLAIRWVLSRSKSAGEALSLADGMRGANRLGDELLEFCFRHVFDEMLSPCEKVVLQVLSIFQRPMPIEAISVGAKFPAAQVSDAVESLAADALVQRRFDPVKNDYIYLLPTVTRTFVYSQVVREAPLENLVRSTLARWYEANDIPDSTLRAVVRDMRQGKGSAPEAALLDLATAAVRRSEFDSAEQYYRQSLQRNPKSWKAARAYAELCRHQLGKTAEAIRLYEQAASFAPRSGFERALIYREWGMLLRTSGDPGATDAAIEKFEIALKETPNDVLAIHALASMLFRKAAYGRVIALLEPLAKHSSEDTRQMTVPMLLDAYNRTGELLKAAELRRILEGESR